ncbi:RuBisCO operon transcriptional regulator [Geomicrobium sp. JCM 19037]|uniref:LysR family transcriptional regulator n=1 Tax=Geomicrobium sp. JCM 19037 TaxID=1460634 RepID=UPI00045F1B57|nr:LysR family transcriptional regulator [Geomicrobium sp. JCM 19037]GAK03901.1 RuBisCO operon transcriptional regulator [Geomicrobium sp. JCM 19037]
MDFKDFEILKAIHEEGNLTKVGNRLFISQPTVTHRIKQLEKQLEITILKRGRKGVEFTDQGLYLLKHSEKLLTNMRTLQENLWNLEDEPHGTLRIGASRSAALHLLPEILHAYSHKHPNVSYTVTDGFNKEIIQSVYKDDVHVASFEETTIGPMHNLPLQKSGYVFLLPRISLSINCRTINVFSIKPTRT